MSWVAVAIGGASLVGGMLSSNAQSDAAQSASQAEVTAANEQANTQAQTTNAELGILSPTRALGGEAQSQLAVMLGLAPVNESTAFQTPQINPNGSITWVGGSGAPGSNTGIPYNVVSNNGSTPGSNGVVMTPGGARPMVGPTDHAAGGGIGVPAASLPAGTSVPGASSTGSPSTLTPQQEVLQTNPDYQFVLGTGENAVNNNELNSGHGIASTGALDAAMTYASGLASTTYQQTVANLADVAGQGTGASVSALESGGAGVSGAQGAAGSAEAAGSIGVGNATTSGIGTALGGLSTGATLNVLQNGGYTNGFGGTQPYVNPITNPTAYGYPSNATGSSLPYGAVAPSG